MALLKKAAVETAPHVAVIGAGLAGLTSAHALLCRGFRVTLLERRSDVASECSFGNAALLMTSYSRPKTATVGELLRWAISRSEPVHVSWRAIVDPSMAAFGLRFFLAGPQKHCQIRSTTQVTRSLATISAEMIDDIRAERGLNTASTNEGLLMFFTDQAKLDTALAEAQEVFSPEEINELLKVVSSDECVSLEPMLAKRKQELVGGLFWPKDRTMCSLSFSRELAVKLKESGLKLELNEDVVGACSKSGKHYVSLASGRSLLADAIVVAAGVGSGKLLQRFASAGPHGLSPIPLYGMRGHSLTVEASHLCSEDDSVLQRSIADCDSMTFFSPLPKKADQPEQKLLRIAGFGDFDGWGFGPGAVRPWRLHQLRVSAEKTFGTELWAGWRATEPPSGYTVQPPELVPKRDSLTTWCGLRPMSPDGLPLIGRVLGKNGNREGLPLFVNAGHGALGWTLSAASGELLAESVSRELLAKEEIMPRPPCHQELHAMLPHFEPNRFRWGSVMKKALRSLRGSE
eukprot:TRINITY_DN56026_c0_g1_i1.p1 TRINITY_DN56026_c0_g1~~TRINITY_DN56026_c0_g1_i1.p1  ORF type:complete len:517 (-),score=58.58 TRINITY_DN56026_c0_g1_i1:158-1708(-)